MHIISGHGCGIRMKLALQCNDIKPYLEPCEIIDFDTSQEISRLAREINVQASDEIELIKTAYEYVRDCISHSADIGGRLVTCKASEVLAGREGVCYAKAHLLAAILRANKVPAGFCYQMLILDDETVPQLILHGLNGVYVSAVGRWIRLDPRGNKPGVDAQFSLEKEQLAFPVRADKGEIDVPIIFAYPDANIVSALTRYKSLDQLWGNLPTSLGSSA